MPFALAPYIMPRTERRFAYLLQYFFIFTEEESISATRISVRTTGPQEWEAASRRFSDAKRARTAFCHRGLYCSEVKQRGVEFVFTVRGIADRDASQTEGKRVFFSLNRTRPSRGPSPGRNSGNERTLAVGSEH